jgi:Pin2-interacting protein X1
VVASRSRISQDPQNTTWANNTSRFGHRILTSQGWTPGSSLGAGAAHAEHYTAASHSHIRVLLKDDNLGLGAKRGSEKAENFGLAGLASILGRLNGNEEEVKKEEVRQEKIQQKAYVYQKYGFMNFVSGGFLVGDKITRDLKEAQEARIKQEAQVKVEIKPEPESSDGGVSEKKSKKRKRHGEASPEEGQKLKRKKKSMNLRQEASKQTETDESTAKPKKDKKEKKGTKSKTPSSAPSATESPVSASTELLTDKARRKAEKRARKEERQLKKALKKAAKEAARSNDTTQDSSSESEEEEDNAPVVTVATATSKPSSAAGLTFSAGGRHAVRQRYIRQKRAALMDPQALKEVSRPQSVLSHNANSIIRFS